MTTIHPSGTPLHPATTGRDWWREAVIYQIYPRSFADHDGDGIGDLPGICSRIEHVKDLGADGVWLSPYYTSPQADAGYDVADYCGVDPLFGTLEDADALIARCHELGLRFITDLVPNHSSDEHPWFQAALAAAPGSPERALYHFRDGSGPDGDEPPNNWRSVFGGPAWTRVPDGQWYLHLFDPKQPDLNWENPAVHAEFEAILRFWLDRGVDGFRVDVAHGLVKESGMPDWKQDQELLGGATTADASGRRPPMWDQDGVHEIYRTWRRVLDEYDERILVAEAWVAPAERAAAYVRSDEMGQAFNFDFLECHWRRADFEQVIADSFGAADSVGAPTTWVLSNHDVVRHTSRYGYPVDQPRPHGIAAEDPQPDSDLGLRRARAATALMLALPGSAYLYQGEELGLPDHTSLPPQVRQDPAWFRSNHAEAGRDGCRIPYPWQADAPSLGFGPSAMSWLPQPESYRVLAADQQSGVAGSTLELYRQLLSLRREHQLARGSLTAVEGFGPDVLAYVVRSTGQDPMLVVTNFGAEPAILPSECELLACSSTGLPGGCDCAAGVPIDTTVWARWVTG